MVLKMMSSFEWLGTWKTLLSYSTRSLRNGLTLRPGTHWPRSKAIAGVEATASVSSQTDNPETMQPAVPLRTSPSYAIRSSKLSVGVTVWEAPITGPKKLAARRYPSDWAPRARRPYGWYGQDSRHLSGRARKERSVGRPHRRASPSARPTTPRPAGLETLERPGLSVSRTSAMRRPVASCHRTHASAGSAGANSADGSARSLEAT